jgi:hypothetical protein
VNRWDHLVQASFSLDEDVAAGTITPRALDLWLASVTEVFDAAADPVEDFEAWTVRRFATSLRSALAALPQPKPSP